MDGHLVAEHLLMRGPSGFSSHGDHDFSCLFFILGHVWKDGQGGEWMDGRGERGNGGKGIYICGKDGSRSPLFFRLWKSVCRIRIVCSVP